MNTVTYILLVGQLIAQYAYIPFSTTSELSVKIQTSLDEIIQHVNDNQDIYSWSAESYPRWWPFNYKQISSFLSHDAISNNRIDHFAKYLGTDEDILEKLDTDKIRVKKYSWDVNVNKNGEKYQFPEQFDLRKIQKNSCKSINQIRDQGKYDNAWAVASASAISDIVCIHAFINSGKYDSNYDASAKELLSCCPNQLSRNGVGNIKWAFEYWATKGIPSGSNYFEQSGCKPYNFPPCLSEKYSSNFIVSKHRQIREYMQR